MEGPQELKWYDRTWLVIILCIVFFPVGLYALWKSSSIALGWKLGYTALVALLILGRLGNDKEVDAVTEKPTGKLAEEQPAPQLTKHEVDSIAKAKKTAEYKAQKNNTVSAQDLVQHYINNEVRADGYFKGKRFYVEGTVYDIGKDILGSIYVTLDGPENDFRKVQCFFDNPGLASQLNKGNIVCFLGTGNGLMMNAVMQECELVKGTWALEEELAAMP